MCNVHFILTLTPSMTAGQGHEILQFCELFLLTGSSLCSLLLRNYLTDFSNDDANQLREQCRCATCTSFWPWPLHDCSSRSQKYFDFVNYFSWRVPVCVRFSSETTRPISPMMIPINWGNSVDVQRALHFDLDPSITAGQGREILRFCEFRLLPWHECWYMSGPYKVAGDRLDLVLLKTANSCGMCQSWVIYKLVQ